MLKSLVSSNRVEDQKQLKKVLISSDIQLLGLTRLVDDLLDVSQMESQGLKLEKVSMDLSLLISDVLESFSPALKTAGCQLSLKLASNVIGEWSRYRIEQVLSNLLMNALKYGAGKPIEVSVSHGSNCAQFSVRDSGPGIAKEHHQHIFERFERVNTSENTKGLGLGLFISYQIVKAHNGRIYVESEPGSGATFIVELPLVAQA